MQVTRTLSSRWLKSWRSAALLAVLTPLVTACGASAPLRMGGYCAPPSAPIPLLDEDPPPAASAPREDRMASLLGLRAALVDRRASHEPTVETRLRVLERIERARLSIASVSAELDCEGERAEQAADYLSHKSSNSVQALTVGSIAAAAATSIASVFLSTRNSAATTQDMVAISGGVLTAGLGLGSLYVHPRLAFNHRRNLLADPWNGPGASDVYPPLVWAYFTRPEFSNEQTQSIREKIVLRWRTWQDVASDPAQVALLFGTGGSYDADALKVRAQMLDELKAEVDLASQDIESLASVLIR